VHALVRSEDLPFRVSPTGRRGLGAVFRIHFFLRSRKPGCPGKPGRKCGRTSGDALGEAATVERRRTHAVSMAKNSFPGKNSIA
jgi:hypothetical protein